MEDGEKRKDKLDCTHINSVYVTLPVFVGTGGKFVGSFLSDLSLRKSFRNRTDTCRY